MRQACETTEPEAIRQQFPFYNEIQSIFAERMQRMLWSEATEPSTSTKRKHNQLSSEDDEEEEEETEEPNQDINDELLSLVETHKKETEVMINPTSTTSTNPRKRVKKGKGNVTKADQAATGSSIKELLEEFMKQTVKMEKEWREAWEMKEREREKREIEWRRRMAELEEERAATERRWIEREEERRLREEARAQKRDTLIDALLTKLNNDHHQGF